MLLLVMKSGIDPLESIAAGATVPDEEPAQAPEPGAATRNQNAKTGDEMTIQLESDSGNGYRRILGRAITPFGRKTCCVCIALEALELD